MESMVAKHQEESGSIFFSENIKKKHKCSLTAARILIVSRFARIRHWTYTRELTFLKHKKENKQSKLPHTTIHHSGTAPQSLHNIVNLSSHTLSQAKEFIFT